MKRHLFFAIKVLFSAGLLTYLLGRVDLADVLSHLIDGDHELFGIAIVVYVVTVVLSTLRWKILLDPLGGASTFGGLIQSYMISAFFANFLPSNIGGDVVRVQEAARTAGSHTASLTVAVVDRIVGFVALYFIAAPAYLLGGPITQALTGARFILAGLTVLFLVLGVLFFQPGLVSAIVSRSGLNRMPWVSDKFALVQGAINSYRARKVVILNAFLLSVVLQFLGVSYFFTVARALRIPLQPGISLLMIPLCTLIQAIPVSFNGWGLREGLYVLYFRQAGLSMESALAFSIVAAALVVLLSLSGLFVWLWRRSPVDQTAIPPQSRA